MSVQRQIFGVCADGPVYVYTIENKNETKARILSYGATWQDFQVKVGSQHISLIEHFDSFAAYLQTPYQNGKTVGRVAGRLKDARFELDGQTYQLPANDQGNLIHGGDRGLQAQNFTGTFDPDGQQVTLTHVAKPEDDGFPGALTVAVTYTLTDDDTVQIQYQGTSTATTLFNPTSHVYFNLTTPRNFKTQTLQIQSDHTLAVDAQKVPTGTLLPVSLGYDFRRPKSIAQGLKDLQADNGHVEFDDTYVVAPGSKVATLATDTHALDLYSDRNGLVIFTANTQDQTKAQRHQFSALAMELQTLPDAIHHAGFGDIVLPKGQTVTYTNRYHYRKL